MHTTTYDSAADVATCTCPGSDAPHGCWHKGQLKNNHLMRVETALDLRPVHEALDRMDRRFRQAAHSPARRREDVAAIAREPRAVCPECGGPVEVVAEKGSKPFGACTMCEFCIEIRL